MTTCPKIAEPTMPSRSSSTWQSLGRWHRDWHAAGRAFATTLGVAMLLASLDAGPVFAQSPAISTTLEPSVRSSGMGRASNAVFWGGDPDYWGNPALLGYYDGIRYEHGSTQLVPDFTDDVYFTTKRITLGAYGLGLALSGEPFDGMGSTRLSYGVSQATSSTGEDLGSFESYEDIKSWGIGLSLGRAVESIWRRTDKPAPAVTQYVDVALGMNWKDVTLVLSPDLPGIPGAGQGSGHANDQGLFVRISPYNSFDGARLIPALDSTLALRLDGSFGISTINQGEVTFVADNRSDNMVEEHRTGWAARMAAHPIALKTHLEDDHLAWLDQTLSPLLSFGAAWDQVTFNSEIVDPSGAVSVRESEIEHTGWELSLLNIVTIRRGHISDPDGSIDGPTTGWSAGLTYAGVLGFRYDEATVPQATDPFTGQHLANVHRSAWTIFMDPIEASRRIF